MSETASDTTSYRPNGPEFLAHLFQAAIDDLDARAGLAAERDGAGGVPTGFAELDAVTGGLEPGTLTVVGAHPGVGASTLVMDFARHAAIKHMIPTMFVTLDSRPKNLIHRLLSAEARIKLSSLRSGRMTDEEWTEIARRMSQLADAPLAIYRPKDRDISDVSRDISEGVENHGLKLVIVDSLHLVTARKDLPYENREREISEITRRLKVLALDLDIAIVATVQLSNNPGPRQLPAPTSLADLRDSGTIAHVADNVILLHRPDAWERDDPRGGEADLRLLKHRQGPTCIVTVAHQLHLSRFADMARG